MRLPNGSRAFVDIRKLQDYSLNLEHERGKHKAKVCISALGITLNDAELLRQVLLQIARTTEDAEESTLDDYGQRYVIDFSLEWNEKQAMIRSTWIVLTSEDFPRLTSCYVL